VWDYTSGADVPQRYTPSPAGRELVLPDECEWPKD